MHWDVPKKLVSAHRLDVFARTDFVRSRISGLGETWSRDLYKNFLHVNGVDGSEKENNIKSTMSEYIRSFEKLIDSMHTEGFDDSLGCIPLSDYGIVNGAHRLAVAIELGIPVTTETTDVPFSKYDYQWFDRRGMNSIFVNAMAFRLISISANARAILIFGQDKKIVDSVEDILNETAEVVVRRRIPLTEIGKRRVVQIAYDHNDWWASDRLEQMTAERFNSDASFCDVIFTIERSLNDLQSRKNSLRKLLPMGGIDRRIHGSDFFHDTMTMAEVFLNQNSLNFLNSAPIGSEERIINLVGGRVSSVEPISIEQNWCIDGSAVLEIHGLRMARDVDFIIEQGCSPPKDLSRIGDNHNKEYSSSQIRIDEILADPRMHLLYKGIKFASLSTMLVKKFESNDTNRFVDMKLIVESGDAPLELYMNREEYKKSRYLRVRYLCIDWSDRWLRKLPKNYENKIRTIIANLRKQNS